MQEVGIDWSWVKKEVVKGERVDLKDKGERALYIRTTLNESIRQATGLASPKYASLEKKIIRSEDNGIEIDGGVRFSTSKIPLYIKGAEKIVLLLVTIGDGIEKEASLLTKDKDPLKGFFFDRIGSFAVESLADSFEKKLRNEYALKNRSVSSRFSPGYCDWPIEEQFKLDKIINFAKIGVRLTEGCMMVPKKSISAIVAVAGKGIFKNNLSGCDICEKDDCAYKRIV